ncbi:MAG: hypothetical protein JWR85_2827 [Marmoricola sp.]|nr:hypothetical protein [Marmoricola sp.]
MVESLRRRIPHALLPLVVWLRFHVSWSRPSVREEARAQMRFLLEHTRPEADLDAVARAYVKRMIWRGELRWHPKLITWMRVEGIEHLLAARDLGRGVVISYLHHGYYESASAALARYGVPCHMAAYPTTLAEDAPGWVRQHVRMSVEGGGIAVSTDVGSQGITDLLNQGAVVTIASDVPGRTPVRFVGRDLMGSFGAARIPAATGSPVVLMTTEESQHGPYVKIHEPLDPADFESPRELLEVMLATHERFVLASPEASDRPTSRWGIQEARPSG